jgi:hypothetical protein
MVVSALCCTLDNRPIEILRKCRLSGWTVVCGLIQYRANAFGTDISREKSIYLKTN